MRTGWVASAMAGVVVIALSAGTSQAKDVTIVLPNEPKSLDPCEVSSGNVGQVIRGNIIETITEINPADSKVLPRLATEWQRVDPLTWRFKLRQGVSFHDGEKWDAKAFVFSFNRTLDPKLDCTSRLGYFGGINASATAVDDLTVEIKTDKPVPILPQLMAVIPGMSPKTPATFTRAPQGTGPFKLTEWVSGQRIVVDANSSYWGTKPEVTHAVYLFREEPAVRAAMVAAGEADLTPVIAFQDAKNSATDITYLNSQTGHIRIDNRPPMNDVRVRKAINLAIDKKALVGTIHPASWQLAANMVMPSINGFNGSLKPYDYDPAQAAKLVAEAKAAGVPVDKEIVFLLNAVRGPAFVESSTVIVEQLKKAGLNVKLQILERNDFRKFQFRPYADDQALNLLLESHDNNSGDAGFTLFSKYHSKGASSKLEDAKLDELIDKGLAAENPERTKLFQDAFARVYELADDAVLFYETSVARIGPRVKFMPTSALSNELQLSQISFR